MTIQELQELALSRPLRCFSAPPSASDIGSFVWYGIGHLVARVILTLNLEPVPEWHASVTLRIAPAGWDGQQIPFGPENDPGILSVDTWSDKTFRKVKDLLCRVLRDVGESTIEFNIATNGCMMQAYSAALPEEIARASRAPSRN